jgi:hypothetical protein
VRAKRLCINKFFSVLLDSILNTPVAAIPRSQFILWVKSEEGRVPAFCLQRRMLAQ